MTSSPRCFALALLLLGCSGASGTTAPPPPPAPPAPTASAPVATTVPTAPAAATSTAPADPVLELHRSAIVVDTHNDVTQRLVVEDADLSQRLPDGQTDLPRMREGGLDAEFLSVFVAPMLYPKDSAYTFALAQFDAIDRLIAKNAPNAVLARTAAEVRAASAADRVAFLIGVEGGHALGDASDAELIHRLEGFYARGARYMTLTWSNSNRIGGSSGDDGSKRGLTPFGRKVVAKMNELGMMVDISHVSDAVFFDVVKATKRPVIASHSSARALSDHPRNMTDDMLRAVAANGGTVCVNFGPQFLDAEWNRKNKALEGAAVAEALKSLGAHPDPRAAQRAIGQKFREVGASLPRVPATLVIDHIDHIAKVAGVDHVCLGSDFDGISIAPEGLDDVSKLPFVTRELLKRGFSESDVRKILGENVLRVLAANEPSTPPH
jgi:membrane dipeptidase